MTLLVGYKEIMRIVNSLNEKDSSLLRAIIRKYQIKSPEELLFITPEEYQREKGAGKIFFLNLKKALIESGIPYDTETLEQVNSKINDSQPKNDALIKLRFKVLERDGYRCQYCGRNPKEDKSVILQVDHIHPQSKGGEWKEENLITSCQECNLGKSDTILRERGK